VNRILTLAVVSLFGFGANGAPDEVVEGTAKQCAVGFKSRPLTFADIEGRLRILQIRGRTERPEEVDFVDSQDAIKRFWRVGWPYLQSLAADNELSVKDIVSEYLTLYEFLMDGVGRDEKYMAGLRASNLEVIRAVETMENAPENAKMKASQWRTAYAIHAGFRNIALFAFHFERQWRETPTFDPLAPLSPVQLQAILDSLEYATLDNIIAITEYHRPSAPALERVASEESPPGAAEAAAPFDEHERSLSEVLKQRIPLRADVAYQARTVFNRELTVVMSPELVKSAQNGDGETVRRLLRGIFYGRGDKNGIKMLTDIGPGIVELKAIMRGHKRILGCLEGQSLVLKSLIELNDSVASYFRRIPADFCREKTNY
jgi:hypothetical protein